MELTAFVVGSSGILHAVLGQQSLNFRNTEKAARYTDWVVNQNLVPGLEGMGISMGFVAAIVLAIIVTAIGIAIYLRRERKRAGRTPPPGLWARLTGRAPQTDHPHASRRSRRPRFIRRIRRELENIHWVTPKQRSRSRS